MHSSAVNKQKDSPVKVPYKEGHSPKNIADYRATGSQARSDNMELRKKEEETKRYTFVFKIHILMLIRHPYL